MDEQIDDPELARAKSRLRREALAARDALPPTEAIENAIALADNLHSMGEASGVTISAYWPIRSEIDPRPLVFALRECGARIALPVVIDDRMVFREMVREAELVPTGFGTYGPGTEAPEVTPDWVLAPLAAFDRTGARLGYGRGYYDRAIAAMRTGGTDPRLIGLAHSVQERPLVPVGRYDVRLHAVLCEDGLRATSGK